MNRIYACIDGRPDGQASGQREALIDWAAWAARRMALPLEFLHVLERHPEKATAADFSGTIGPDAQDQLLQRLSDEDARRSKAAREAGRALLATARARAAANGPLELDARLRHGDLVATLAELAADAALIVLGEQDLEAVVRAVQRPILAATTASFVAPQRVVLAFDGSAHARQAARQLADHPLTAGLPVLMAMVGAATPKAQSQLDEAAGLLSANGLAVESRCVPGEAQRVLPELVKAQGPALLVMGAYGHSRLHELVRGSTTKALLQLKDVPVLVMR